MGGWVGGWGGGLMREGKIEKRGKGDGGRKQVAGQGLV